MASAPIDGYLENERDSNEEGDDADEQDQDLVMLQVLVDPVPEPVLQGGDDDLNGGELKAQKSPL